MPKRKSERNDLDHIKKKIKKLERKLLKARRRSSSSDSIQLSINPQDDTIESQTNDNLDENLAHPGPSSGTLCLDSMQSIDIEDTQEHDLQPLVDTAEKTLVIESEKEQTEELDEVVLQILGSDPLTVSTFGKDIQKDLAVRFEFITTSGLTKELRKELYDAHLPPANCKKIAAPFLNPEIKAAVAEAIVKRDIEMIAKQKQICCAISCIGEAITYMLAQSSKDPILLKLLMDTGRILCDAQHGYSITRRNFILACLKKELKDQMQLTKIDSLLFGQELAETLRTAKAINKSGAELKPAFPQKNFPPQKKHPPANKNNLNLKAPATNRRPAGPPRAKESAQQTRLQHASSRASRPSTSRGRR